jgi:small conductance mechanosensitive channel
MLSNRISSLPKSILIYIICFSPLLCLAAKDTPNPEFETTVAQDSDQVEQDSDLLVKAKALIKDLDTKTKEQKKQFELLLVATGEEDIELAGIQVLDLGNDIRKLLDDLIAAIDKLTSDGLNTDEFMAVARALTKEQSESIIEEIDYVDDLMDDLRLKREKTEPASLFKFEQGFNQGRAITDKLYQALLENTERKKRISLYNKNDLKYLRKNLNQRAAVSSAQLKLSVNDVDNLKKALEAAGESQKKELGVQLTGYEERKTGLTKSLSDSVSMMKQLGLETSEYGQQLVLATGAIDEQLLDVDVVAGLFEQWLDSSEKWVIEHATFLFVKLMTIIFILFIFKLLAILAERLVRKAILLSKATISKLLQEFFENVIGNIVMLIGVLFALSQLGLEIGPLLAGLGIAGFIVGFALQDTLSNFASGLMILLYRPYDVGDVIEAAGMTGTVEHMSLVSTTVYTFDNQKLIIPNNKIWGDIIRNVTSQEKRRVDFVFEVGEDADIEQTERILNSVLEQHDLVLADPEPVIKFHKLSATAMEFIVRPWVNTPDYWQVYWDITRMVKQQFDKEGIPRAIPEQDVYLYPRGDGSTSNT